MQSSDQPSSQLNYSELYNPQKENEELHDDAKKKLAQYVSELKEITESCFSLNPAKSEEIWAVKIQQFYLKIVFETFQYMGVKPPDGMEIYLCGSLAKKQATPYSDIDSYVLLPDEEDSKKFQMVFDGLHCLFERIAELTDQLVPDPVGFFPAYLNGTPEQVFKKFWDSKIKDSNSPSEKALRGRDSPLDTQRLIFHSFYNARPLLGYELGERLKEICRQHPIFTKCMAPSLEYRTALNEAYKPKDGSTEVDVKQHIIRPLYWILAGLQAEFELNQFKEEHLSFLEAMNFLEMLRVMPEDILVKMQFVFSCANKQREVLARNEKKESDIIDKKFVIGLLKELDDVKIFFTRRMLFLYWLEDIPAEIKYFTINEKHRHILNRYQEYFEINKDNSFYIKVLTLCLLKSANTSRELKDKLINHMNIIILDLLDLKKSKSESKPTELKDKLDKVMSSIDGITLDAIIDYLADDINQHLKLIAYSKKIHFLELYNILYLAIELIDKNAAEDIYEDPKVIIETRFNAVAATLHWIEDLPKNISSYITDKLSSQYIEPSFFKAYFFKSYKAQHHLANYYRLYIDEHKDNNLYRTILALSLLSSKNASIELKNDLLALYPNRISEDDLRSNLYNYICGLLPGLGNVDDRLSRLIKLIDADSITGQYRDPKEIIDQLLPYKQSDLRL